MTVVTGQLTAPPASIAPEQLNITSDSPNINTPAYLRSVPRWQLCRDLMRGVEYIRDGTTQYVPKYPGEDDDRYEARIALAGLFNGFERTVQAGVGLLTQQEPTLGEDMPPRLADMWENVDASGTHGAVFTRRLIQSGMVDGYSGILVEYPKTNDPSLDRSKASQAAYDSMTTGAPLDAADEAAMGLRPYFCMTRADEIVLPLYETMNGRRILTLFIHRRHIVRRVGKFGLKSVTQYCVYYLKGASVVYELWEGVQDGIPVLQGAPMTIPKLKRIPWSPLVCGEEIGPGEYKPTLIDLAYLVIEHHNIKTNILSLESLACVPTPVRLGATKQLNPATGEYEFPELILGPSNTIEAPAMQGIPEPVYWLSPPVDVLNPAMKSLDVCTQQIGAMGASFLVPQPIGGQETATAHRLDATAEKASISTVGRAAQDCLELAFEFAGEYIGVESGSVTMNHDFESTIMSPQMLTAYVGACVSAGLPTRMLLEAMQKGGLIESGTDLDELNAEMLSNQAAIADQKALEAQMANPTDQNATNSNTNNPPAPEPTVTKTRVVRGKDGKAKGTITSTGPKKSKKPATTGA